MRKTFLIYYVLFLIVGTSFAAWVDGRHSKPLTALPRSLGEADVISEGAPLK